MIITHDFMSGLSFCFVLDDLQMPHFSTLNKVNLVKGNFEPASFHKFMPITLPSSRRYREAILALIGYLFQERKLLTNIDTTEQNS